MEANNMKAMREALVGLAQAVQDFMATKGRNFYPDMAVALDAAAAALAAPPRNCDVGSVEEQTDRYLAFCSDNHVKGCFTDGNPMSCPVAAKSDCRLAWAQLTYIPETKGAKNE